MIYATSFFSLQICLFILNSAPETIAVGADIQYCTVLLLYCTVCGSFWLQT